MQHIVMFFVLCVTALAELLGKQHRHLHHGHHHHHHSTPQQLDMSSGWPERNVTSNLDIVTAVSKVQNVSGPTNTSNTLSNTFDHDHMQNRVEYLTTAPPSLIDNASKKVEKQVLERVEKLTKDINTVNDRRGNLAKQTTLLSTSTNHSEDDNHILSKVQDLTKELDRDNTFVRFQHGSNMEKTTAIDINVNFGELEPFGREDTAQELTQNSVLESNNMVDQVERAEVAEEKRATFRALTRLRGAAITSFDGVARAQTENIDNYNRNNKWRDAHPVNHLAEEESDVRKWAFSSSG